MHGAKVKNSHFRLTQYNDQHHPAYSSHFTNSESL